LSKNFTHLTLENRVIIEDRLKHGKSLRSIAKELNKSPSTIMREVQNYSLEARANGNDCKYRRICPVKNLCGKQDCNQKCARCKKIPCKRYCKDYEPMKCERLSSPSKVCNGCLSYTACQLAKITYNASKAQKLYEKTLTTKRAGFDITKEQLDKIEKLASPMLKKGCSPYHIKQTYKEELPVSERSLRRMVNLGVLSARNIDLRDMVKRKVRTNTRNKDRLAKLKISKLGHLWKDYLEYIENHEVGIVEMDCVEGKQNENETLLTLTFKSLSLQLAFIMDAHTSESVIKALDKVELSLGTELFQQMFPLILTDNGHEFADVEGMERSINGGKRTKIFFCEPNRSDEKGTCENHHRMIRWCIPKGTSLVPYKQNDISLMMNHINSYKRDKLFGKSAYEVARAIVPNDFFALLGLEEIPPSEINLTPSLFNCI